MADGTDAPNTSSQASMFQRLMELKEAYEMQKRQLGLPPVSSKEIYKYSKFSPDNSDSDEDKDKEKEDYMFEDEVPEEDGLRRGKRRTKSESASSNGNVTPALPVPTIPNLQSMVKTIIEKHGGSCHLETIVEHVKAMRQKEQPEGPELGHADYKRAVQANFRSRINNRFVFLKDKDNDGYWTLNGDDIDAVDKPKILATMMGDMIEENGGSVSAEEIISYIQQNWHTRKLSDGTPVTNADLEFCVRTTLNTNPRFMEDPEYQDYYLVANINRKKRKLPLLPSERDTVIDKPSSKWKRKRAKDDDDDEIEHTVSRHSRLPSPNGGVVCRGCGAHEPGANGKWRRGPKGENLCATCASAWNKKHACPVCGKVYKKSNNNESDEEDNAWIRCDDCHRWVMTKCDNIEDISIYDDSNPNHLHYSCPLCRGDLVKNTSTRNSKSKSNNTTTQDVPLRRTNPRRAAEKKPQYDDDDSSGDEHNEQPPEGKLEATEKELIEKFNEDEDIDLYDEDIRMKLKTQEEGFIEDISQYTAQLIGKRGREQYKNQIEFDRQLKKLKEEKERLDEATELELVQDLKNYYRKQKKEYDRVKNQILRKEDRL